MGISISRRNITVGIPCSYWQLRNLNRKDVTYFIYSARVWLNDVLPWNFLHRASKPWRLEYSVETDKRKPTRSAADIWTLPLCLSSLCKIYNFRCYVTKAMKFCALQRKTIILITIIIIYKTWVILQCWLMFSVGHRFIYPFYLGTQWKNMMNNRLCFVWYRTEIAINWMCQFFTSFSDIDFLQE